MQIGNPYAWILILTTFLSAAFLPYIWRRRRVPGGHAILALLAGATIWSFGYGLQLFSTRLEDLLFWTKIVYIGVVTVSTGLLVYTLELTGNARWLTRRYLLLLLVEPLIALLLIWTNELHGLMNRAVAPVEIGGFIYLTPLERGPAFWVHIAYTYLILGIASAILLRALLRSPHMYRGQIVALLVAAFAPWLGNIIHLVFSQLPVDPTPLSFTVTGLALVVGISRYRLLNLIPVARELVLESMEDAVLVLDDLHRVVDANPSANALFGSQAASLVGQSGQQALKSVWEPVAPFLVDSVERGEVNLGSAGEPHWFDLRVSILRSRPAGVLTGRVLVFHDIQHRKRAEELMTEARDQALQASMVKSQLLANVSHDLRTPLNAIIGFSEMLLEESFDPLLPRQAEVVGKVYNAAQQMNLFVSDLLDQSLIEKGKLVLYPTRIQPLELVRSIEVMFARPIQQKGLRLECEIDPRLPAVLWGDTKRLQQVLMNLVGNAVKFTAQGSISVRLGCSTSAGSSAASWVMEVRDTGIGIPPEARGYIFEPFRQVDGSPTRPRGGVGLGLAIARHLVMMMGGNLELESELGQGSTFRVTLPLALPPEES